MQNKHRSLEKQYLLEIDIVLPKGEELEILSEILQNFNLQIIKIIPKGPAGGNPCIYFTGAYNNLYYFLENYYFKDEENALENHAFNEWIVEYL